MEQRKRAVSSARQKRAICAKSIGDRPPECHRSGRLPSGSLRPEVRVRLRQKDLPQRSVFSRQLVRGLRQPSERPSSVAPDSPHSHRGRECNRDGRSIPMTDLRRATRGACCPDSGYRSRTCSRCPDDLPVRRTDLEIRPNPIQGESQTRLDQPRWRNTLKWGAHVEDIAQDNASVNRLALFCRSLVRTSSKATRCRSSFPRRSASQVASRLTASATMRFEISAPPNSREWTWREARSWADRRPGPDCDLSPKVPGDQVQPRRRPPASGNRYGSQSISRRYQPSNRPSSTQARVTSLRGICHSDTGANSHRSSVSKGRDRSG